MRASTSDRTRKLPPSRKTSGSSVRWSEPAVSRTDVRRHQADEPDDAAGGDARGGEQRGAQVHQPAGAFDVDAEMQRRLVAEGEEVEGAAA